MRKGSAPRPLKASAGPFLRSRRRTSRSCWIVTHWGTP